MRQRMEQHRANPAWAVCHRIMDPLGFALENFDGLGRWRDSTGPGAGPIDSSGVLPDDTRFEGPAALREVLLSRRELFVETFTERLLTYALGRGVEEYDRPVIRKILTPILEPLAQFRDRMLVLSGLDQNQSKAPRNGSGSRSSARLHRLADGNARQNDLRRGLARRHLRRSDRSEGIRQTHSARLARGGLESAEVVGACESAYGCAYYNTISWRNDQLKPDEMHKLAVAYAGRQSRP